MRDPKRIERILKLIEARWKEAPDQRLGQLLMNFSRDYSAWPDIWGVEDKDLEKNLQKGWEHLAR